MTDTFFEDKKWNDSTIVSSHLCRICFSLSDLLIPIFEGEGIEEELFKKIQKYLPVKISPIDNLPQKICYSCAGTLKSWDSLFIVCLKTDKIFQTLLQQKPSESSSADIDSGDEPLGLLKKRKLLSFKEKKDFLSKTKKIKTCKTKKNKNISTFEAKNDKMNVVNEVKGPLNQETNEGTSDDLAANELLLTSFKTELMEEVDIPNAEMNYGNDVPGNCLIKCEFCTKSYKDKKSLSRHMKKTHEKNPRLATQKCDLCSNIYKTRINLERHYIKEHLTDQVECPVCHSSFNSKKLDLHLKSVHGVKVECENEEKFKCKMCDKWFKNKYIRNSHVKEVHLSEPMKCKLCDFEGVRTVLRRHKREVHAEKKFSCSLCPGAFKTLHTLKRHMTSHSNVRCFTCDICGMGFKRLNNVRDHMKCHEEKSNQCQICGNFFARKRYLAIHEKTIHNFYADGIIPEEKGFECGTCGAKLKWKKNLLAHMRIHTGEKPYVCKVCNKDFICHGSLRSHMSKHSVSVLNEAESQNQVSVEVKVFNNFHEQMQP